MQVKHGSRAQMEYESEKDRLCSKTRNLNKWRETRIKDGAEEDGRRGVGMEWVW